MMSSMLIMKLAASLPGMSLRDRFCSCRKYGLCPLGGPTIDFLLSMSGLDYRKSSLDASFLLRTNGLRKQALHLAGPPFLAAMVFSVCADGQWPRAPTIKSSLMTGWLQRHLCEVWSTKTMDTLASKNANS